MTARRIAVVTVARSDYGLYYPLLRRLEQEPTVEPRVIAAGMHLVPAYGLTIREIEADGFPIAARLEFLLAADTPQSVATSMGLGVMRFADSLHSIRPHLLVVLGDRIEMLAAALAALPMKIPVAHIHGGELTIGAIDDAIRHAITKVSHLHLAAAETYARRIRQMGEEPWRVFTVGSPAIDNLLEAPVMDDAELRETLGLELEDTLLVTYHPVTLEYEDTERQTANLLEALRAYENEVVFTYPNADTANTQITQRIEAFTRSRPRTHVCVSLGRKLYPNLLRHVRAVVGNSSSGIIEASTFGVPVVNIGRRQEGRVRPDNVIDVGYGNDEIRAAIGHALTDDFRRDLGHLTNPYGDGRASERIAQILREIELDDRLVTKRFSDWPEPNG